MIKPFLIIVSSNYLLNYETLSRNRSRIYEILRNKKLGKENNCIIKRIKYLIQYLKIL